MKITRYRLFLRIEKYLIHKNAYDISSNVLNTRTLYEYYVVPSVRLTCELLMMVRLGPTTRVPLYTPEEM